MSKPIASGRQLAKALGVSESTTREYLARPDWPIGRTGPWTAAQVEQAKKFREQLQENRAGPEPSDAASDGPSAQKVNTALKLEKMLHERLKRRQREGQLVERALLDGAMGSLTKLFVDSLSEMERALPLQIAGREPGEVERIVHDRIRGIREALSSKQVIELANIQTTIEQASRPKAKGRRPGVR